MEDTPDYSNDLETDTVPGLEENSLDNDFYVPAEIAEDFEDEQAAEEYARLYGIPEAEFDPKMPPGLQKFWRTHKRVGKRIVSRDRSRSSSRPKSHSRGVSYYHMYDMGHRSRPRPHTVRGHWSHSTAGRRFWVPGHRALDPRSRSRPRTRYVVRHSVRRVQSARMDPLIPGLTPGSPWHRFVLSVSQPILTAVGEIGANAITTRWPKLAAGFKVGNSGIGYFGLAAGMAGAVLDSGKIPTWWGKVANDLGSGAFANAVNIPSLEKVVMGPTQNAYAKSGYGIGAGAGMGPNPRAAYMYPNAGLGFGTF